ncbi:hypothetical protein AYK25_03080 [Thermoplasmatales archaeon SM1-50]|nr:MAG: hypothetical protein AYK25_03080 [Thermoplasmatales archaeon SM1-50]
MKEKILKKNSKNKKQETKQGDSLHPKEEKVESMPKEENIFHIPKLQQFNTLMKLRISVSVIFFLCTISIIFIFLGGWPVSAFLLLMGYIFLFILMIKLFLVKKL